MLYFIKGRAGSGKTGSLHKKIIAQLNDEKSKPLLVIPEQFSFETERSMLKLLGPKKLKSLEIFSFSRLAFSVLKDTDVFNKKIIDEGIRALLMTEALSSLEGRLSVFSSEKSNFSSISPIVEFYKELKQCGISSDDFLEKTKLLDDGFLKEKMNDVALINEAYDALAEQSYFDNNDTITLLTEYAEKNGTFKNKTVFFDGFRMFSKQEFECFDVILSQADNVYVTLCEDNFNVKYGPFEFVNDFEKKLRIQANKRNVSVNDDEFCIQNEDAFSSDIFTLEKNIYNEQNQILNKSTGDVVIAKCVDKYDECKFVASKIKNLIRSGKYRCKDIAIIERTDGTYKDILIEELKYYDIPVFDDSRRSLKYESLFVYINALLTCITDGFKTETVLNYLKSGLCNISLKAISDIEKYALMWNLKSSEWTKEFTNHPDGFGKEADERSNNQLDYLNKIREKVIAPVVELKDACENKTGAEITRCVFEFVDSQNVQDCLYKLYTSLKDDGFPVEAERQAVSWDIFVNLLDKMSTFGENKSMSLSRWFDLFCILVDSCDVGEIPQGLDEIRIGSADRIRTEKLKVVFLVGVNSEEFPLVSVKSGVLTDSERAVLTNLGLDIRPSYIDGVSEERFIAYCAITAANEKLFLSYKTVDSSGGALYPSELISLVENSLENVEFFSTSTCNELDMIESDDDAFSLLARNFSKNNCTKKVLEAYFSSKEEFAGRLNALRNVAGNRRYKFEDSQNAVDLFGKDIKLSASKIDTFYMCPFAYFVQYGLNVKEWRVAELDPANSGTVIHHVLEKILFKFFGDNKASGKKTEKDFSELTEDELNSLIKELLDEYNQKMLSGASDKEKRFAFIYNHIQDVCLTILLRLQKEFSAGNFKPCGFEVEIGGDKSSADYIPPYTLPLDIGEAVINGKVDRVDEMINVTNTDDGATLKTKYLRVIDYKSGKKEFKLGELLDGINLQMVLYLMALKKLKFADYKPAAVLYLPSKINFGEYLEKRSPLDPEIENASFLGGKYSGMILEDKDVFDGMGYKSFPKFFPAGYKEESKGRGKDKKYFTTFSYNTYSEDDFNKISDMVNSKIVNMGNTLHNGEISAIPWGSIKDGGDKCAYCSYRAMCGYEDGDEIIEKNSLKHAEAISEIGGDDNGEEGMDA